MEPLSPELIERVEDEFGISVFGGEARYARTEGDLHILLARKLNRRDTFLSLRSLYVTRRALADALGVPRHSIEPRTRLADLLPPRGRADSWSVITRNAGGQFPRLHHSNRMKDLIMLASMAMAAVPLLALWWALYALDWIRGYGEIPFMVAAAIAFLLIESRVDKHLLLAAERWANELPSETVRDLAQRFLEMNPPALQTGRGMAPSSEYIRFRLCALTGQDRDRWRKGLALEKPISELEEVN